KIAMAEQEKTYTRFTLSQRLEHWVLTLSFTVLVITGLPQRYALSVWADLTIRLMGGIEFVRILHRIAATILAVGALYHILVVAHKVYVLRVRLTMLPGLKDLTDFLDTIRYNLGLAKRHPKLPRYTFAEKVEYWALIWGTVLMGITGFMLWNPIATASYLPGELIPAAKTTHSAEALLATLAIIVWHIYGVHIKTFNRSMFSGKLTRKQMLDEHAGELEEIETSITSPPVPEKVKRRRERTFLPVAIVSALVMGLGLYAFVTIEETAITTVPPAEMAQAFVRATPMPTRTPRPTSISTNTPLAPPTPTSTPTSSQEPPAGASVPVIPHPLEGREDCLLCHAADAVSPFPADHVDWLVSTCQVCHAIEGEVGVLPPPVKHSVVGRDDCLLCHAVDLLPESHQAAQFTSEECLLCHPTDSAADTEEAPVSAVSFAGDIQPLLEANCATCHGETALGGLKITEYQSLADGGQSGPAFEAGSPNESLIVTKMSDEHPGVLTDDDLQMLIDWITNGAESN
ncbi:MAG: cytochrome b/b6 domain-containing protein, partial [Anaerolineae bacterium]